MSTKEKLLDDLTEVEEIHPNYVSAVITGGAYFNEPPKIDLKNDHPHLIIYTYKEGDGCWGIAVQAHWDTLDAIRLHLLELNPVRMTNTDLVMNII